MISIRDVPVILIKRQSVSKQRNNQTHTMKIITATTSTSISLLFYHSLCLQDVAASQSRVPFQGKPPKPRPRDSTKRESRMKIRPSPPSASSLRLEGATPSALDERYQVRKYVGRTDTEVTDTDTDAGVDTYTYSLEFEVDMGNEPIPNDCLEDRDFQDHNDSNFTWSGFLVQLPDDAKFLKGSGFFTQGTSDDEGNALIRRMLLHNYEFTTDDEHPTITANYDDGIFLETFKFDFPDGGEYQEISKDLNGVLGCSDDDEPEDIFIEESPDDIATNTNQTLIISLRRIRRVTTITSSAVTSSGRFVGIATAAVVLVSALL